MDDLKSIAPNFLLDSLGIKMYELASYISNQFNNNMSKSKIKKEIEKILKIKRKKQEMLE